MDSGWQFITGCFHRCRLPQRLSDAGRWGSFWDIRSFADIKMPLCSISSGQATAGPTRVRFENVVQRFRVIRERPDTLREAFTRVFRYGSHYHDFEALKGISFEISDGEMVGIVGRNGSGKSTTLKIIAGVYRPTSGVVTV